MTEYFMYRLRKVASALEGDWEELGHLTLDREGDEDAEEYDVPDRERLEKACGLISDALGELDVWFGKHEEEVR